MLLHQALTYELVPFNSEQCAKLPAFPTSLLRDCLAYDSY